MKKEEIQCKFIHQRPPLGRLLEQFNELNIHFCCEEEYL